MIGVVSCLMIFSSIHTSEAELHELIIEMDVQKGIIHTGETVEITGKVVNHAYNPIRGAEVVVKTSTETIKVFTNPWGEFKVEFKDFQKNPGSYNVNVLASWYEMRGLSTTQFQVKGDISPVSILQDKLSTDEAIKYLSSKESDFEKNPIGQTLFKYYHELLGELTLEKIKVNKSLDDQKILDKQRKIAKELEEQAIEEAGVGFGVYEGYQYDVYISNLNPEIKDIVIDQLNFTKNTFEDAQKIRDSIIKNGGTVEEARQAYLDMISIPIKSLEEFNQGNTTEESIEEPEESIEEPEESIEE